MMEKDDRYKYIHPLVFWGRVKEFSDIFDYLSKSTVAEALGKEKSRFTELIHRPYELTFESVYQLSKLWKLSLQQMATLIRPECSKNNPEVPEQKDKRYNIIVPLFKENKIKEFKDILDHIPKSVVADDIGKKVTRFDRIEEITVMELFIIGNLCELGLAKMFNLVKTQYSKENKS
jgi:hypothetical protein